MKIVTLTLNPALDKSTATERFIPEQKLRCEAWTLDAGGGGINVSKGIGRLGGESTAVMPLGGPNGQRVRHILEVEGVDMLVHPMSTETRENVSVTESSTNLQYRFTLAGAPMKEADADACLRLIEQARPDLLVASGSLPPGLPVTYYEKVAALAKKMHARLILDTSGAALQAAADEGLYLLKPNLTELSALVGANQLEMNQVDDAALEIIHQGKCEIVVVSLGPQGALLVTRDFFEHIPAPTVEKQTTVGAGDSMVAGMAWAMAQGLSAKEMVQWGVACGSAATMSRGTHLFYKTQADRLLEWIKTYGERYRFKDF